MMSEDINSRRAIEGEKSKYIKDFEALFAPIRNDQLIARARSGTLGQSQFRSICWRYFLGCLENDHTKWSKGCQLNRANYDKINASCSSKKPRDDESTEQRGHGSNHHSSYEMIQLSTITKSHDEKTVKRHIHNEDRNDPTNIFRIIQRDVVRTFPDMEFFRQSDVQNTLISVLFNYACIHNSFYKQGMHELLATLLYVMHTDTQNCLINYQGGYANEIISDVLQMKYVEHDLYNLFSAFMTPVATWYQNDEILCSQDTPFRNSGLNRSSRQQVNSVLGVKLKTISETLVRGVDPELYNHLEALQIAPQIYGIRWMRLLFGREFEFIDLLNVWDAIICDERPMSLTDYIFASMLITNREELVNGDYTDCLNNLMRHQFKDTNYVINLALYLRNPSQHSRPFQITSSNRKRPQNKHTPETSLASKLNQQYISDQRQHPLSIRNNKHPYSKHQDDLHSVVDYCWRLLSEQIDSLQRCLPNEKSLNSEDEIYVALAQLKKVRDVLKGSLKLEDELEAALNSSKS